MANAYVTRCYVKKNSKMHKKGSVMEGLTAEEIKKGLAERWLEKIGNDDDPSDDRTPEQKKRDRLLSKAEKAGITVDDRMADEEIEAKIAEAYKRKNLLDKAAKLGVEVKGEMTNEEIQKLIKEAKKA